MSLLIWKCLFKCVSENSSLSRRTLAPQDKSSSLSKRIWTPWIRSSEGKLLSCGAKVLRILIKCFTGISSQIVGHPEHQQKTSKSKPWESGCSPSNPMWACGCSRPSTFVFPQGEEGCLRPQYQGIAAVGRLLWRELWRWEHFIGGKTWLVPCVLYLVIGVVNLFMDLEDQTFPFIKSIASSSPKELSFLWVTLAVFIRWFFHLLVSDLQSLCGHLHRSLERFVTANEACRIYCKRGVWESRNNEGSTITSLSQVKVKGLGEKDTDKDAAIDARDLVQLLVSNSLPCLGQRLPQSERSSRQGHTLNSPF